MARNTNSLTHTQIVKAKPKDKPYKLMDGKGLYILVAVSGSKLWKVSYKSPVTGRRPIYSMGAFPDINLSEARERLIEIKRLIKQGIDPVIHDKEQKAALLASSTPFRRIAQEWLDFRAKENKQDKENVRRLNANILPAIGDMPYLQVTKEVMQDKVLSPIIEREAYHEAKRNKDILKLVLDFAINKYEVLESNPAIKLQHPKGEQGHFDALTKKYQFKQFVKDVWAYRDNHPRANLHTDALLKLSILIFVRPSEIRTLTWSQYNPSEQLIEVYSSKVKKAHIVPLAPQAIAIMQTLQDNRLSDTYIFPTHHTGKNKPLSDGVIRRALNKLGYKDKQTAHGLRASARTILDEELEQNIHYLESQITHDSKDNNSGAYNRSKYLRQRKRVLTKWANYLDALRNDEDVSRFKPVDENDPQSVLIGLLASGHSKDELMALLSGL